jgi:hypothetical protein
LLPCVLVAAWAQQACSKFCKNFEIDLEKPRAKSSRLFLWLDRRPWEGFGIGHS